MRAAVATIAEAGPWTFAQISLEFFSVEITDVVSYSRTKAGSQPSHTAKAHVAMGTL